MKICFLMHTPFKIGGAQKITSLFANFLIENGYEVDIISTFKEKNNDLFNLNKNINIIYVENNYKYSLKNKITKRLNKYFGIYKKNTKVICNFLYDVRFVHDVVNKINEKNYDVVIGVEAYYSMILGIIKDKINSKTIAWQHNSFDTYFRNKYKYFWNMDKLFKKTISKVDKNIVLTNYDKEKFDTNFGINSICINNFVPINTKKTTNRDNNTFITIGRFNYNKGYDLLIKSFKLFNNRNKDWKLTIIGNGKNTKILKMIKKYNLQNYIKIVQTTNVEKYLLNSDIYLLSSRYEGMSLSYLEAIKCGLPVICYDIPVMLECTKGNAIIVKKFDYIKFAEKMLELANDKIKQKNLGESSNLLSDIYSKENILKKWLEVLKK